MLHNWSNILKRTWEHKDISYLQLIIRIVIFSNLSTNPHGVTYETKSKVISAQSRQVNRTIQRKTYSLLLVVFFFWNYLLCPCNQLILIVASLEKCHFSPIIEHKKVLLKYWLRISTSEKNYGKMKLSDEQFWM